MGINLFIIIIINGLYRNKECHLSEMISGDENFQIFSYETKEDTI